jgi:hypothetical protein
MATVVAEIVMVMKRPFAAGHGKIDVFRYFEVSLPMSLTQLIRVMKIGDLAFLK